MTFSTEALQEALLNAVQNAHIEMSEEALLACQQEVAFVIGWAKEMEALPLETLSPTVAVNLPENCPVRPDVVTASLGSQEALAQAPAKLGSCFIVPQIIE